MVHVFEREGARLEHAVLRSMFAARKQVFIDLLKWDVPIVGGSYEIDQFDDEHASYLVLTDERGEHLGSARLLPTTRPHILGDLFSDLCEEAPPRDPAVFEITRFCLDRALGAAQRRAVRDTLVTALAAHALSNGIATYTAIAEMGWFQQILAFGWRCRPLGVPQEIGGIALAALRIEIDADTPDRLAASGITAHALPVRPLVRQAA